MLSWVSLVQERDESRCRQQCRTGAGRDLGLPTMGGRTHRLLPSQHFLLESSTSVFMVCLVRFGRVTLSQTVGPAPTVVLRGRCCCLSDSTEEKAVAENAYVVSQLRSFVGPWQRGGQRGGRALAEGRPVWGQSTEHHLSKLVHAKSWLCPCRAQMSKCKRERQSRILLM